MASINRLHFLVCFLQGSLSYLTSGRETKIPALLTQHLLCEEKMGHLLSTIFISSARKDWHKHFILMFYELNMFYELKSVCGSKYRAWVLYPRKPRFSACLADLIHSQ